MPKPQLHFIGREAAAPELIVRWCRKQWPNQLPPGLLFCVPTSLALRRLRDALTKTYTAFQGVSFCSPSALPKLFTPEPVEPSASAAEMLRVWDGVFDWLQGVDAENLIAKRLFPGRREWLRRPKARYAVAKRLMEMRATLAEAGLDFGSVAAHPATAQLELRERERWVALDALECKAREILQAHGLEDAADVQLRALRNPIAQPLETGCSWHLIIACVPDFMPALRKLFSVAPQCDVLVQANPEEADRFDLEGLPLPEVWETLPLELPDEALVSAETPADEATAINAWLDGLGTVEPQEFCFGIFDREIMPPLTAHLAQHGVEVFAPEPLMLSERPAARVLCALSALATEPRPENLLPLMCHPEVATAVASDYATLRAAYAEVMEGHCPRTLAELIRFSETNALATFATRCLDWVAAFRKDPVEGARSFLIDLYGRQEVEPVRDPLLFATFEALQSLLDELAQLRVGAGGATVELLLARLSEIPLRPVRGAAECAYEGRMEVLWSSAPRLILAGLNEGVFPDTTFEDAFLPNEFRRALGLRNDRTRAARDAYILSTACAARTPDALLLLSARSNTRGDWLRPSRLFFRCAPQQCVHRANVFFGDAASHSVELGTETGLAFATNPSTWGGQPEFTVVSASMLRRWLQSPLEWWFKDALGLSETADLLPDGVTNALFGTLLHTALQTLHGLPGKIPEELTPPLLSAFDAVFYARYGGTPDVELLATQKSAHHRLRAMARLEASLRAEGWECVYTESHTNAWRAPLEVNGKRVFLQGQIDRIDRHRQTGAWRIIDYKTGASVKDPNTSHYRRDRETKQDEWHDFQLPIYRLIMRVGLNLPPSTPVELAYIIVPGEGEARLVHFDDPEDEAATEAALREAVAGMLATGQEPLAAAVGVYGNPLLAQLVAPTDPGTKACSREVRGVR